MNGPTRLVLDTTAAIAYFRGHRTVIEAVDDAEWIGISAISVIEFFVYPFLPDEDAQAFKSFANHLEIIQLSTLDEALGQAIIDVRRTHRLKLPDAIVAGSAIARQAVLLTSDPHFRKVSQLKVSQFEPTAG